MLEYPWLNAMEKNETGVLLSYCSVLKIPAGHCTNFEQYSPDQHVSADSTDLHLSHMDDELVSVKASMKYYRALRAPVFRLKCTCSGMDVTAAVSASATRPWIYGRWCWRVGSAAAVCSRLRLRPRQRRRQPIDSSPP